MFLGVSNRTTSKQLVSPLASRRELFPPARVRKHAFESDVLAFARSQRMAVGVCDIYRSFGQRTNRMKTAKTREDEMASPAALPSSAAAPHKCDSSLRHRHCTSATPCSGSGAQVRLLALQHGEDTIAWLLRSLKAS